MMWLRNMVDAGWSAKEQALGGALATGATRRRRLPESYGQRSLAAARVRDYGAFLPKNEVLEEPSSSGVRGTWSSMTSSNSQRLATWRGISRSARSWPGRLSAAHSDCAPLGRFPAGYRVGVQALHGSAGQGVALVHRSVRRTTLVLSHVVGTARAGCVSQPAVLSGARGSISSSSETTSWSSVAARRGHSGL